jgi:hypothetical protein
MPHTRDDWSMLVVILGSTINPLSMFWPASEEVEEGNAQVSARSLNQRSNRPRT